MIHGRELTGDWQSASAREWLVTNSLGGFAAGTVSGANTRRYHGVLIASLRPPVERTLLLAKVDLSVQYDGRRYDLAANEFDGGVVHPRGYVHIESFRLRDGIPTWCYAFGDALLQQQIFMAPLMQSSYLGLRVLRATLPMDITLQPLCAYRDYHAQQRGAQAFAVEPGASACTVRAFAGSRVLHLSLEQGKFAPGSDWYWNFFHRLESERGLDAVEDLFTPGRFITRMIAGERNFFLATIEAQQPASGAEVLATITRKSKRLIGALPVTVPPWIQQLALASDQFIVRRPVANELGSSIIAGFPWFSDWGRDAMIALPGLTGALARHDITREVLETFVRFVNRGMLPNRFPDGNEPPEYNTVDATLWLFHALEDYLDRTGDLRLPLRLLPTLLEIIEAHVAGTRYGIGVDSSDGLLRSGEPGVQLTWMDAKLGDWVVTPRNGKCVEINALWLNALHVSTRVAQLAGNQPATDRCERLLAHAGASFNRFWNAERACLYDVIDVSGGSGSDASLRPNQLFAVSLPFSALQPEQMRSVIDICARELLTSYGLRSLGMQEPAYVGRYQGDVRQRDGAYHQGTVWSWLLGPFALAHYRVYGDAALAQSFLEPMADHLHSACEGSISEIFDGDAPHPPRGCFAQAWSVGEVLRAWIRLEQYKTKTAAPT